MKLVGLQSFIRWIFFFRFGQLLAALGLREGVRGGVRGVSGHPEGVRDRLGAILEPSCGNARQRARMRMCARVCVCVCVCV